MTNDPAGERILRAKYLDWCSAKVADRFLEMTPDQIYELAHLQSEVEAAEGVPLSPMAAASQEAPAALSYPAGAGGTGGAVYLALVERVAEVLAERLQLPTFEEWASAYLESPESFDAELLGFWRSRTPETGSGSDPDP